MDSNLSTLDDVGGFTILIIECDNYIIGIPGVRDLAQREERYNYKDHCLQRRPQHHRTVTSKKTLQTSSLQEGIRKKNIMKVTFLIAVCTLVVLLQQMQTPLAQYAETSSYVSHCTHIHVITQ